MSYTYSLFCILVNKFIVLRSILPIILFIYGNAVFNSYFCYHPLVYKKLTTVTPLLEVFPLLNNPKFFILGFL